MKKVLLLGFLSGMVSVYADQVLSPTNTFLTIFENNSHETDFKIFVGTGDSRFLLIHASKIDLRQGTSFLKNSIRVSDRTRVDLVSVTGQIKSIFIKFGGYASGQCKPCAQGPFYFSTWREFSDTPELGRDYVRYYQTGPVGHLGLRINEKGDPEFFAVENTEMLS
ncbi:MAG: hypothetical protein WD068_01860 [Candidatus Babeliales bacterium]